ncbi:MAG: proline racemase family protein [Thermomicrobiales bacterium]|nr:proline racemase family protein [Thermomicrobiales bacterium]
MRVNRVITAVDAHAGGEPGRVITGGVLDVPGETMFAKMQYLQRHQDGLRKLMLREPRGYPALCCNLILPPTHPDADAGFVIMEQVEYPPMSGSNTICSVTVLLETGMLPMTEPVTELVLEAPAGLVRVCAQCEQGKVTGVTFRNVPAFAAHLDATIDVPTIGSLRVDVAYGGMWYVLCDAADLGLEIVPEQGAEIVRLGEMVKAAAREQLPVAHPDNPDIAGVSIIVLSGPPTLPGASSKNTVVVSTGQFDWADSSTWTGVLDRSACGTGTCARMAVLHAKGQLPLETDFVHESIMGTTFTGRLIEETTIGDYPAVIPEITGQGWITGMAQYVVDPSDPFQEGFIVGDLWGGITP